MTIRTQSEGHRWTPTRALLRASLPLLAGALLLASCSLLRAPNPAPTPAQTQAPTQSDFLALPPEAAGDETGGSDMITEIAALGTPWWPSAW